MKKRLAFRQEMMILKDLGNLYLSFLQKLKENRGWSVTALFALFVLLSFGISYNLAAGQAASSGSRRLPIYCVDTDQPQIALTFDAAWGNEDTGNILDILKKNKVKATFFMTGGWVSKYPDDVLAIHEQGHALGNHSENHKQMSQLSAQECLQEISAVHDRVKQITGAEMEVFRPPYGDYNNTLIETCQSLGYYCIQWDVDSLDWKDYGPDSILSTVINHKHLGNGSIILCHNGSKYTAKALDALIKGLKEKGYEFVTVPQLIHKGAWGTDYEIDHEGRQLKIE